MPPATPAIVAALPAILAALRATPDVPVSPHDDGPLVTAATRRALERAGYRLTDYEG